MLLTLEPKGALAVARATEQDGLVFGWRHTAEDAVFEAVAVAVQRHAERQPQKRLLPSMASTSARNPGREGLGLDAMDVPADVHGALRHPNRVRDHLRLLDEITNSTIFLARMHRSDQTTLQHGHLAIQSH